MENKGDIKEKIKKIYEVLPKLDDKRCGYRTCGEFARAVAEEKAPCDGCITGGPGVSVRVCAIMGARVPEGTAAQSNSSRGVYQPGLVGGRGMGRGMGRGRGMGHGFGRGRRLR